MPQPLCKLLKFREKLVYLYLRGYRAGEDTAMRKNHFQKALALVLALALFASFSGCGEQTPEVKHNDDPLWRVKLEGANPEYVEDYEYLWDLLENEYPMLNTAQRITGKNAENEKMRFYYNIPYAKTPQDFYDYVVQPCISAFGGTGHLSVLDGDFYIQHYAIYKSSLIRQNDSMVAFNCKQLAKTASAKFYKDQIKELDEQMKKKDAVPVYNEPNNLTFASYPGSSAGYIKIKKMNAFLGKKDDPEYQALQAFFKELEAEHTKNCIIDIRGNIGGSDGYWSSAIVCPNLRESVTMENYELINGDVCKRYLTDAYQKEAPPISALPKKTLPGLCTDDVENARYFIDRRWDFSPVNAQPLYSGRFWLLVDESNYAAAESFVAFCKVTGFATLVGETTGGDGIGQNPIIFSLPNTGICIRFSAANGLNPDGSCNEEAGTVPDYPIKANEDALVKCLSLISGA